MDDNMNTDRGRGPDAFEQAERPDSPQPPEPPEVPEIPDVPEVPGGPDADSLSRSVMRLGRLLMRHEHITRSGRHGRSARIGQGRVLALLALREPLGQKDLAYLLGVRPQSLSELLGKLEHAGLVSRERDESDRRSTLVSLTAEGRGAAEEAARSGANEGDPFDVLDDAERAELARLAGKVSQALIDSDGEPGPHGPRGGGPRRGDGPRRGEGRGHRDRGHRWDSEDPRWDGERKEDRWGRPDEGDEPRERPDGRNRKTAEDEESPRGRKRYGRRRGWGRDPFRMGGAAWA
ncbi:MAG: MarR family winged helix-turn-helix transcriptional regulator [Pauljensenia sp.]